MKKVYDWDVCLSIHVQNNNKKITIICSIHTTIHQLKIQICKKLGLPIFDTEIDIYGPKSTYMPMKSISTLQQNGIENKNVAIKAVIRREKTNLPLNIRVQENVDKKLKNNVEIKEGCGLSLVGCCVNHQCINYQQDTIIYIGYGQIPFYKLIAELKCDLCPYRSQFLRPTMMCKGVKLSHCLYKIQGTKTDPQGIPSQLSTKFVSIQQEKDIIKKITQSQWDKNITLIIKHL